jgi:maltooligosyltrehalose trehalohydrolase
VWAPTKQRVDVVLARAVCGAQIHALSRAGDGTFRGFVAGVRAGDCYRYRVDGAASFPDPASRFQPLGVHGVSMVVDPDGFAWNDGDWRGIDAEQMVLYELHVGTFTPAGSFAGVSARLPYLRDLGVTAVELMPVADFPGARNWGYDGAALFAPARCYGHPDDLRRLVDAAHRLGLGVVLDVVYNHLGPDGAYLQAFSPYYLSKRHRTPWGGAVNLDGAHSEMVRAFFIENALHWVHEYHVDGLRLDATHALIDRSPRHFLAELTARVRAAVPRRHVVLMAEDHRNLARLLQPEAAGGWGMNAVWADDFHHQLRRALAGDRQGYYRDFTGSTADLATTVRRGWFYCGQHSAHAGGRRGTDPKGVLPRRFVMCLDNHDQVGNRAFGERLHQEIDPAAYRAASVLLLCAPETPLLFMGQEWAASTPFLFFTDHEPKLGRLVTEGRRREFRAFSAFADPRVRARIPDPQARATFVASRLNWSEFARMPHAATRRLYGALIGLRRTEPLLREAHWTGFTAAAAGRDALVLCRRLRGRGVLLAVIRLRGAGPIDAGRAAGIRRSAHLEWEAILSTEEARFAADPMPVNVDLSRGVPVVRFVRPGAVMLRGRHPSDPDRVETCRFGRRRKAKAIAQ